MRANRARTRSKPVELPAELTASIETIKKTQDPQARAELAHALVGRIGALPGPVQTAVIEQLQAAARE